MKQTHPCTAHVVMTKEEEALLNSIVDLSPYKRSELLRKCFFEGYRNEAGSIYAEDLFGLCVIRNSVEGSAKIFAEDPWLMASRKEKIMSLSEEISAAADEKYRALESVRTRIKRKAARLLLKEQAAFAEAASEGKQTCQAAVSVTKEEHAAIKKFATANKKTISRSLLDPAFSGCAGRAVTADSFRLNLETIRERSDAVRRAAEENSAAKNFAFAEKMMEEILREIRSWDFPSDAKTVRREAEKLL